MPTVSIPLTQGKIALIDEEDYALVSQYRWHAIRTRTSLWYASTSTKDGVVRMHRLLMGFPQLGVDHRNGDGLDNRRENLRVATHSQNSANYPKPPNLSGFRGVWWDRPNRAWRACLDCGGKRVLWKKCRSAEQAARMYDDAARRYHGEFAILNFPEPGERGTDGVIR